MPAAPSRGNISFKFQILRPKALTSDSVNCEICAPESIKESNS